MSDKIAMIPDKKIPTIKVGKAALDPSQGKLAFAKNDVGTLSTQRYTVPSCLGLTGVLAVNIRATEPIPYQLMGEVTYVEDVIQGSDLNTHTISFKVFVFNPQPRELTVESMTVSFAYLSND